MVFFKKLDLAVPNPFYTPILFTVRTRMDSGPCRARTTRNISFDHHLPTFINRQRLSTVHGGLATVNTLNSQDIGEQNLSTASALVHVTHSVTVR